MTSIGEVTRIPTTTCEFQWSIPDFSSLSKKNDECYLSPQFWFAGKPCNLSIAPNGYRSQKSVGYFGLYLIRRDIDACFSPKVFFSIKTADGEIHQERLYEKYDPNFQDNLEIYGISSYLLRSELLKRKSELLPSDVLTVLCTVKYSKSTEDTVRLGTAECSFCEKPLDPENVSSHEQKCTRRPIKCPECSDELLLQDWQDHECPPAGAEGGIATAECSYCQKHLFLESVSAHEKKCKERLIKCPECSVTVLLLDWYYHECWALAPRERGITATAECSYCRKILKAENIVLHETKCISKPMKCPECSAVILLQERFYHQCQTKEVKGETSASGFSIFPHDDKVLLDLKDLFLKKEDCDVIIKVKGQEFPAHKTILKARSSVLASTFSTNMKEKATGILEIDDCEPSSFSDFLCFLYCGDVSVISEENVFSLFTVADKYDVQDLRAKCMKFVYEHLSIDTFCDTIALALRHSETELIKLATDFFTKNAPKIIVTVKWQVFLQENPTQSNELLVKLLVNNQSSSK